MSPLNYTPDFFVIKKDTAGWIECKPEEELRRLTEVYPERYLKKDEDDQWHCPPGEKYAEQFGFFFQVVSSASLNAHLSRNMVYLYDYFCHESCSVAQDVTKQVLQIVEEEPGITLEELRLRASLASSDDINVLIAKECIYFDLYKSSLAEPRNAKLFLDEDASTTFSIMGETPFLPVTANTGTINVTPDTVVLWNNKPWRIINLGETKVTLLAEDERQTIAELLYERFYALINHGSLTGLKMDVQPDINAEKARELLNGASRNDLRIANYRHQVVMAILQEGISIEKCTESERTIRYWLSKYHNALKLYGKGYVGLLPKIKDRGNRKSKIDDDTVALVNEFILEDYQNLKQMNKSSVYKKYEKACEDRTIPKVSYKVFIRKIKEHSGYEQTRKRQGRKAAYNEKTWYWELEYTTPRHGDRPWEIGHIDHTQLEIELIDSKTKKNLGRPWVTILTDAYTRRILAIYLTFDKPSYRSCMMVLRECVRKHNRLPQIMVHDGGAEFHSIYFESLLAQYGCTRKMRPGSEPRFGSLCERLFGTVHTEFIHNLVGNTQIMKNVRQVTKNVNPKELAIWTFETFYRQLCLWCYEYYDQREHPALGQSPAEAFATGLAIHGARQHMHIKYDKDFVRNTLPTTSKGTVKVQKAGVIKINYISYWTKAFDSPEVKGTHLEVRYDPFDISTAYVYVNKKWAPCISDYRQDFKGRSEREIQIASAELHKRNQRHAQLTQKQLALFLRSVEAEEVLLLQRMRDSEVKHVLETINGVQSHELATDQSDSSSATLSEQRPASVLETGVNTQERTRNLKRYEEY